MKIGPSFAAEMEAAGLMGLPFAWDADGITYDDSLSPADRARVEAVLAAHDSDKPAPEIAPDSPTNSDWRVGLILWGRFAEVEAKVIQARDAGTVEGLIAWQRWEYANNVYRAELMTLKDAFGFTADDVEESLRRAAQVAVLAQGQAA